MFHSAFMYILWMGKHWRSERIHPDALMNAYILMWITLYSFRILVKIEYFSTRLQNIPKYKIL